MHIIVANYPAAAPSDTVFRVLCTNSLTYLLILDLFAAPRSSILTPFLGGGGDSIGGGPTGPIGKKMVYNSNTAYLFAGHSKR